MLSKIQKVSAVIGISFGILFLLILFDYASYRLFDSFHIFPYEWLDITDFDREISIRNLCISLVFLVSVLSLLLSLIVAVFTKLRTLLRTNIFVLLAVIIFAPLAYNMLKYAPIKTPNPVAGLIQALRIEVEIGKRYYLNGKSISEFGPILYTRTSNLGSFMEKYDGYKTPAKTPEEYCDRLISWVEKNRDYLYYNNKHYDYSSLCFDEEAMLAGIPSRKYRKTHPWSEENAPSQSK